MASSPFVCSRCTRALQQARRPLLTLTRRLSHSTDLSRPSQSESTANQSPPSSSPEKGPMARRLEEATEEALLTGGRAGRRAVEEAGFSEELKSRLLDKLADAKFESDNAAALAEAGVGDRIPSAAGEGTRHIAASQPWTGEESHEDAALRMLHDARKPLAPGLRGKPKIPQPSVPVDMRLRRDSAASKGQRAASARDKAQAYAGLGVKEKGLTEEERKALREEFRERFRPGARAMPNTISGLAALANERIEDAIARGQFKNIPRGKGIERDARADNPFIDTTEYIMNKMIKRQDIVPPWIEKQQELLKAANVFRSRLRNDWRRHAARMIASRGGSLQEQMARAEEYARAEEVYNPRRKPVNEISIPTNATDDAVMASLRQQSSMPEESEGKKVDAEAEVGAQEKDSQPVLTRPFRDPDWEVTEKSYMELSVSNLNAITRSYNLMAPELAKKPYFSLQRELDRCFAEVAPQLANEIKVRAAAPPKHLIEPLGRARGALEIFGSKAQGSAKIYDSKAPHYGLKEFWRDIWGNSK